MHRWRRSNCNVFGVNRLKVLASNLNKKDKSLKKTLNNMKELVSDLK